MLYNIFLKINRMLKIHAPYLNLKYTLECWQCFRRKNHGEYYTQILIDRVVKLRKNWDYLFVESDNDYHLKEVIYDYFDFYTDYQSVESEISQIDDNIKKAVSNTSGLRILNQNFFEIVISYIISANNNIPRISKSIGKISQIFGQKVIFENQEYYLFPKPSLLQKASISDLQDCGVWYRAPYIIDTVSKFCEWKFDLDFSESTEILRKELLQFKWIWPKVADCILLFSLQKKESFPIDTRVEKVMNELYIHDKTDKNIKKDIQKYVKDNFWSYAWLIQEHLFYNKRMGRI